MKAVHLARHFLVDRLKAPLGLKDQLLFSPLLVQMVVTRRCNLTCGYCNEFDEHSAPVPLEQLRSRITKAAALGTLSIEFTGGEPLLHPNLLAVIEHATQTNFAARMMISNAYLLTEETIHGLNEAGLSHMQVSIDGAHPNRTTVKVLNLLRKKLELLARNAKFAVQLSAVVGAAPQEEVVEVVSFAKDMGFRPRVLILHDSRGELKLNPEQLATYESIQPIVGRRFRESHGYREKLIRGEPAPFKCRAGARYIYVDEEGLARYCSQQRKLWGKPFLDMTEADLRHNFHSPKACNGRCTIGCARTVSAFDEWRAQRIQTASDKTAVVSPVAATMDDRRNCTMDRRNTKAEASPEKGADGTRPYPIVLIGTFASFAQVGGRTLAGRTIEQFKRAGCPVEALVYSDKIGASGQLPSLTAGSSCSALPETEFIRQGLASLPAERLVLLIDGTYLFDQRLILNACHWERPGVLIDSARADDGHQCSNLEGAAYAGMLAVTVGRLRHALEEGLTIFGVQAQLRGGEIQTHDIADMPTYSRELRQARRPFWLQVLSANDRKRAAKILADASGKGHQELMVLLCNRPIETFLARYVCNLKVTPNQITVLSLLTGFAAIPLFWGGHLWWGIFLALITDILDGLDGRQARIQIKTSKLGELEHVGDKVVEIGWMLALGWHFSGGTQNPLLLWMTLGWVFFHFLDNAAYSLFRRRRRMMIDEARPFDRAFRGIVGCRNNNVLLLTVGVAIGAPLAMFKFILAWSAVTALVHWIRIALLLPRSDSHLTWGEQQGGNVRQGRLETIRCSGERATAQGR